MVTWCRKPPKVKVESSRKRRVRPSSPGSSVTMRVYFLSVLVATWLPSLYGLTITPYPSTTFVGEDATFVVTGIVGGIRELNWYKGADTSAANQFFRLDASGQTFPGNLKIENATLLRNGSLLIQSAQTTHSGNYIVLVQANEQSQAQLNFNVLQHGKAPNGQLSDGEIAAIAISVIVVLAAISGGGAFLYKKKQQTDSLTR